MGRGGEEELEIARQERSVARTLFDLWREGAKQELLALAREANPATYPVRIKSWALSEKSARAKTLDIGHAAGLAAGVAAFLSGALSLPAAALLPLAVSGGIENMQIYRSHKKYLEKMRSANTDDL